MKRINVTNLVPGMQFFFDEEYGGDGGVVTVAEYPVEAFGLVDVRVKEYDFDLSFMDHMMVQLA